MEAILQTIFTNMFSSNENFDIFVQISVYFDSRVPICNLQKVCTDSGNGLMSVSTMPLPEPLLTKMSDAMWQHQVTTC